VFIYIGRDVLMSVFLYLGVYICLYCMRYLFLCLCMPFFSLVMYLFSDFVISFVLYFVRYLFMVLFRTYSCIIVSVCICMYVFRVLCHHLFSYVAPLLCMSFVYLVSLFISFVR